MWHRKNLRGVGTTPLGSPKDNLYTCKYCTLVNCRPFSLPIVVNSLVIRLSFRFRPKIRAISTDRLTYFYKILVSFAIKMIEQQRCHSKRIKKTLDGPLKKPQKTPGQISMQLAYILGQNATFPEKRVSSPPKFLMTFFTHQLWFSNFHPFIDQKLRKQQLIPYFFSKKHSVSAKNTWKHVFSGEIYKKTWKP